MAILQNVIFLDLETTGLGENDEIMEVGAVKIERKNEQTYQQLVNPTSERISPRILKLCRGLTEQELRLSPRFEEIKGGFLEFIGDYPLVCHNAPFEKRMLETALGRELKNTFLDSLELFVVFKPHFPRHNMELLLRDYLGEERPETHRALADAKDTMALVEKLLDDLAGEDAGLLEQTLKMMHGTGWNWLSYLQEIVPASLQQVTASDTFMENIDPACPYTLEDIPDLLEDKELWQLHFPDYQLRPQQQEMAEAVAEAFRKDRALFIEAPTGSGKTLTYLLTSLLWAVREKEKVFISTNTLNLQQQLLGELPGIAKVLGIQNIRFADMKGISNYACRRRVEEEAQLPSADPEEMLAKAYLLNWSGRSLSGELEEISYWLRKNNPFLNRILNRVRCRREDCTGKGCSYNEECFYNRRVQAMQDAHLCTINHSLLLTWPNAYPEIKRLIIDEAHVMEEKAFETFTREVSSFELKSLLERLVLGEDRGYLHYLRFFGRKVLPSLDINPSLGAVRNIRQYTGDISTLLEALPDKSGGRYAVRCDVPRDYDALEETVLSTSSALSSLASFLEKILEEINDKDEDFENNTLFRQGEDYIKTCRAWAGLLEECFDEEVQDNMTCRYLEYSPAGWSFRSTPLDVAEPFYKKVLSNCDALVMTSATLAEKGGYERPARVLGFDRLEEDRLNFQGPLPNVYDYANNSVVAAPADSPGYKDDRFVEYAARAVTGVAKMLGGRTLVLFSSLERMEKVITTVRPSLEKEGISVLGAVNSSRRSDLEHFREDLNSVLFGSKGLFEGIDVKGPALSCIIIEKLSFLSPADPLYRARRAYLEESGLNSFIELDLAEVARTLRQQYGRLIRSETDRGIVLVLDQLGGEKWYCSRVIEELPGPRVIRGVSIEEVLERLKDNFEKWGYRIT